MPEQIRVFGWPVKADVTATAEAQGLIKLCSCAYCRNYYAAHRALPSEMLEVLRSLGVDPSRPAEAVELC